MGATGFLNREGETQYLMKIFKAFVWHGRTSVGVVLEGREGSGKSALVRHFISTLFADNEMLLAFHKLSEDRQFTSVSLDGADGQGSPYRAFAWVLERLERRSGMLKLVERAGTLGVKLLPGGDFVKDLVDFARDLDSQRGGGVARSAEVRQFVGCVQQLRRETHQQPLLLHIEHAELLDRESLDLLTYILTRERWVSMMVMCEFSAGHSPSGEVRRMLQVAEEHGRLQRVHVRPFAREVFGQLVESFVGPGVFTEQQLERLYESTHGLPGPLAWAIDEWKKHGALVREGKAWRPSQGFAVHYLEGAEEKYLKFVREFLRNDARIDAEEAEKLRSLARTLGISDETCEELLFLGEYEKRAGLEVHYLLRDFGFARTYKATRPGDETPWSVDVLRGVEVRVPNHAQSWPASGSTSIRTMSAQAVGDMRIIATEWVPGRPLLEIILGYELDVAGAIRVMREITRELNNAHEEGLEHRFVRPELIMVADHGAVHVGGFGVEVQDWKKLSAFASVRNMTAYLAPEVMAGKNAGVRSNVFSLGVLLYELIAGISPFRHISDSERLLGRHSQVDFRLEWLAEPVRKVVSRSLEDNPANRYANYRELLNDLDAALDRVGSASLVAPEPAPARRLRGSYAVLGGTLLVAGLIVMYSLLRMAGSSAILEIATPPSLTHAVVGRPYAMSFVASGAGNDVQWSVDHGILPEGMTLGRLGGLTGVPTRGGTYTFSVGVVNGKGERASKQFTLNVRPGDEGTAGEEVLPPARQGELYEYHLSHGTMQSPVRWSLISGSMPQGMSMMSDGFLRGNPISPGSFRLQVLAKDARGMTEERTLELEVLIPGPSILSGPELPAAQLDKPYHHVLRSTSIAAAPTWRLLDGSLPGGLEISENGVLHGTPRTPGRFRFQVQVSSSGNLAASKTLSIFVRVPSASIATESPLPVGKVGQQYSQQFLVETPVPGCVWSVETGEIPSGTRFEPNGKIEGVPTASGRFAFRVRYRTSDGVENAKEFTLVVERPSHSMVVDRQPHLVTEVPPALPPQAVSQDVRVAVLVGVDGRVLAVETISIDKQEYENPAHEAARRYTFSPALKNSSPIECWKTLIVRFRP